MRQGSAGSVADGRYEVGGVVGRGRRSRVHAAYDRILHRPVALKFFPAGGDGPTPRWRAEAAALNRFDHAHLLRLLDGGEAGDEAFLVLPLMTESLAARLDRGALSSDDSAAVVLALADALGHVHRAGLVHGAVDADAVLLDPFGRPCWGGLPDPATSAEPRAVDEDLHALAELAVRMVTGDGSGRPPPAAVLDAVRAASATGRVAGARRRLACALEATAPVPARSAEPVVRAARWVRRRGRPGFAAALALAFAASVLGAVVVDGRSFRSGSGVELDGPGAAAVLADPAGSDVVSSVQGALNRLGTLATEPAPAPVEAPEPRVVRVAQGDGSRPRPSSVGPTPARPAPDGNTPAAPAPAAPAPAAPAPAAPAPAPPASGPPDAVTHNHDRSRPDARNHEPGGVGDHGDHGGDQQDGRGPVGDFLPELF